MTFEEFKQKIKDDVEYYLANLDPKIIDNNLLLKDKYILKLVTSFFIAGTKLGFKKGMKSKCNITTISDFPLAPEWHDLRKDPTDIPPMKDDIYSIEVWAKNKEGTYGMAVFSYGSLKDDGKYNHWLGISPILWCELPRFDED